MTNKLLTASLSDELPEGKDGPPTAFRIMRAGENRTKKGNVKFTERSQKLVLEAAKDYGNRYLIDYRHKAHETLSLDPAQSGKAAGWCSLEVKNGELWAKEVEWTPTARKMLTDKEYLYFSPIIDFEEKSREVVELQSVALTNRPATKHLTPLMLEDDEAELEGKTPTPKPEIRMKTVLKQLGLSEEASESEAVDRLLQMKLSQQEFLSLCGAKDLSTAVGTAAAWKASHDKLGEAEKRIKEMQLEQETQAKTLLLEQAKKDGQVPPSLKEFVEAMPLEQLKAYVGKAPKSALGAPGPKEAPGGSPGVDTLSLEDKKAMQLAGVDEKAFLAAKSRRTAAV